MIYCRHIEANKSRYIETLREAVAIKSVSAWPDSRSNIFEMVDWTVAKLAALGVTIELVDLGQQTLPDGRTIPLPKAILGVLGNVNYFLCSRNFAHVLHSFWLEFWWLQKMGIVVDYSQF